MIKFVLGTGAVLGALYLLMHKRPDTPVPLPPAPPPGANYVSGWNVFYEPNPGATADTAHAVNVSAEVLPGYAGPEITSQSFATYSKLLWEDPSGDYGVIASPDNALLPQGWPPPGSPVFARRKGR